MPIIYDVDLNGVFAPLPSPYTDDGSTVSEIRLARVVRHLHRIGVDGFAVCCESGEFPVLGMSERKQLVELAVREANGKPVLAGVVSLSTRASLDLAQHAQRHGARAVICGVPMCGELTDDEVIGFFQTMAAYAGLPILVVDPIKRLNPMIEQKLDLLQPICWTKPFINGYYQGGTHTDEFAFGEAIVTPIAALQPSALGTENMQRFAGMKQWAGAQRVLKSAFEIVGLDCGPLRGPYRSLNHEQEHELRTVLRETRPEEPATSAA